MNSEIHPAAVVHPGARLGAGVRVGPYAVIEEGVLLGEGTAVAAHAVIRSGSSLGARCRVDSHAVIGGDPQDLRFDPGTPSGARLGIGVVVREGATIHRATRPGSTTTIGDGAFLMAGAHVGHDCTVGERVVIANNVMLAGFVQVGGYAFLGGGAACHQFVRIGESAMVGGIGRCSRDVPPFSMMAERDELIGLNLVGLKRREFPRETIAALKRAFAAVYRDNGNPAARASELLQTEVAQIDAVRRFLEFFTDGRRGFIRPSRVRRQHQGDSPDSR